MALHRHWGDNIPVCLQPVLINKVQALVEAVEQSLTPKEGTPVEYRKYMRRRDAQGAD